MGNNSKEDMKLPLLQQSNDMILDGSRSTSNVDQRVTTTIMFKIGGVECASCSTSIESVLQNLNGVMSITVSPIQGQAVVKYISELVSLLEFNKILSKLLKWSLRFGHFCYFSPKLKPFESGSLGFQFCCHFHPKSKSGQIF
ncbi:putative translocase [Helianthus anomalus]